MAYVRSSKLFNLFSQVGIPPIPGFDYDPETNPTLYTEMLSFVLLQVINNMQMDNVAMEVPVDLDEPEPGQTKSGMLSAILGLIPTDDLPAIWQPVVEVVLPAVADKAIDVALSNVSMVREIGLIAVDRLSAFALDILRQVIYDKWLDGNPGESIGNPDKCCEALNDIKERLDIIIAKERTMEINGVTVGVDTQFVDFVDA